jgi:uncharacterized membrane protein
MRHNRFVALTVVVTFVLGMLGVSVSVAQDKDAARHAEINAAMKSLQEAEQHLHKAGTGYGGNKAKAEEFIKRAQKELRDAVAYIEGDKSKAEGGARKTEKK